MNCFESPLKLAFALPSTFNYNTNTILSMMVPQLHLLTKFQTYFTYHLKCIQTKREDVKNEKRTKDGKQKPTKWKNTTG